MQGWGSFLLLSWSIMIMKGFSFQSLWKCHAYVIKVRKFSLCCHNVLWGVTFLLQPCYHILENAILGKTTIKVERCCKQFHFFSFFSSFLEMMLFLQCLSVRGDIEEQLDRFCIWTKWFWKLMDNDSCITVVCKALNKIQDFSA